MYCRYTLRSAPLEIASQLGLSTDALRGVTPRYNILPGQQVLAFREGVTGQRKAVMMRWGYPSHTRALLIHTRVETIANKLRTPSQGFAAHRCLIPADGFYAWQKHDLHGQPFFIHRANDKPFALAGIWRLDPAGTIAECLIVIQAAGDSLRAIHNRQPLCLEPEAWETWLSTKPVDAARIARLLAAGPSDDWAAVPVTSYVNSATHDDPRCILPADADWPMPLS